MKTYKYKTLKGLLSQTAYNRVNLYELITNRLYLKGRGYCVISLSDSEKMKAYNLIANAIYSSKAKAAEVTGKLSRVKLCGIIERLYVDKTGGHYCAGQNYISEIKFIQGLVRNA